VATKFLLNDMLSAEQIAQTDAWKTIKGAALTIRGHQVKDGSIPEVSVHQLCSIAAHGIAGALEELAELIKHDRDYLLSCANDFRMWADGNFAVPDFFHSLSKFHPETSRENSVPHAVVFPMYTQNGNPSRNFEAVITNTYWPGWLSEQERTKYNNPAFVPIEFVGFTSGYDTNSAVFFPETVAVREVATYYWGGIFCDREAARFRKVRDDARARTFASKSPFVVAHLLRSVFHLLF